MKPYSPRALELTPTVSTWVSWRQAQPCSQGQHDLLPNTVDVNYPNPRKNTKKTQIVTHQLVILSTTLCLAKLT